MKSRPILFNTEMIQAILDSSKNQTRRVIKPDYIDIEDHTNELCSFEKKKGNYAAGLNISKSNLADTFLGIGRYCPYGQPGDWLWVRETFTKMVKSHQPPKWAYKADAEDDYFRQQYIKAGYPYQWKSPIYMPKEAARIWLKVEDVRVERVQDIRKDRRGILHEGYPVLDLGDVYEEEILESIKGLPKGKRSMAFRLAPSKMHKHPTPKDWFVSLWDSINKKKGYGWESNPWVWVIEFKVLSTTGKPETT